MTALRLLPALTLLTAFEMAGCGGPPGPAVHLTAVFQQPEVADARRMAPDLMAAADRARADAKRAAEHHDRAAAEDHATRARLLVAAAVAESTRLQLEKERLAAERKARALEAQARNDDQKREQLVRETRRMLAAQVAREQAVKSFADAAIVEERGAARRGGADRARHHEAAEVLRGRARLLLAAARALGLGDDVAGPVEQQIEATAKVTPPSAELAQAEAAVEAALRALGKARASRPGPTPEEVQGAWEMATEMGFAVDRTDRGTVLRPASGRWSATMERRLASLLASQPAGPVRIEGRTDGRGRASERRARSRAARLEAALVRDGVAADRVDVAVVAGELAQADLQVVLVSYVSPGR